MRTTKRAQWRVRSSVPSWLSKRALVWAGYAAFFFACFLFFAYQTFPYDRVRDKVIQLAAGQGYEVEIIDLGPSWLTGLTMEGVRVVLPAESEGTPPLDLTIDELTVRISLLPLIWGTKAVSFEAELADGEVEGDVSLAENETEVEAELEGVNLRRISALRRYTKIPVEGIVTGTVELDMPQEVAKSTGSINLSIEGLSVGDSKSQIQVPGWGGLTVDRADLGTLELAATVTEGVANIQTFKSHGKDLKLDASGNVKLQRPLPRSQLNLLTRLEILDAYKKRSSKIESMLDLASARPQFKSAQTSDGAIQYKLSGLVGGRIRPKPAGRENFKDKSTGREAK